MIEPAQESAAAPLTIREGVDGDASAVVDLIGRIYAEYGQTLDTREEPHLLAPSTYFRQRGGEFWVAFDAESLVGTCGVKCTEGAAELKTLYVDPRVRRRALATTLVARAASFATAAQAAELRLWSDTRFLAAHRLYHRLGFELDGLRELGDSNQSWEFGFRLLLAGPTRG